MLIVANRPIHGSAGLSPRAQSLLALVRSGADWIAFLTASSNSYDFATETGLIAGAHSALFGSPLLLLPRLGLAVHPAALDPLSQDELSELITAANTDQPSIVMQMRVGRVLSAHGLLTDSHLQSGYDFLKQKDVSNHSVFSSMSFGSRIALNNLVEGLSGGNELSESLQKEAAAFAVSLSQTPLDFIGYFRFYLAKADVRSTPALRATQAQALLAALSGLLFSRLGPIKLDQVPSRADLPGILSRCAEHGASPGFPALSAALAQVARFVPLDGPSGEPGAGPIQQYMQDLAAIWTVQPPALQTTSQDGLIVYTYRVATGTLELLLSSDGLLFIGDRTSLSRN